MSASTPGPLAKHSRRRLSFRALNSSFWPCLLSERHADRVRVRTLVRVSVPKHACGNAGGVPIESRIPRRRIETRRDAQAPQQVVPSVRQIATLVAVLASTPRTNAHIAVAESPSSIRLAGVSLVIWQALRSTIASYSGNALWRRPGATPIWAMTAAHRK
jgi:hypothetical protein